LTNSTRLTPGGGSASLHKVVSRLKIMPNQEPQTSQTHGNSVLRNLAEKSLQKWQLLDIAVCLDMKKRILLVEDEEGLRMALGDRLQREGYVVDPATDGDSGFRKATSLAFDLIILDIMLPGRNGLDLCHALRVDGIRTPILLLTARGEIADKIAGLKLGADAYVTKPFDMRELMVRIEVLLRRAPAEVGGARYRFGLISVETRAMAVTKAGNPVHLSAREFHLLVYFIENAGLILSRDRILNDVWGYESGTLTRTLDVHVASLRQKLEMDPTQPELILTVPGVGYRFRELIQTAP
jgi:two-component system, OmpR family, alkaline phosphatase synthesis response regulator PhoP